MSSPAATSRAAASGHTGEISTTRYFILLALITAAIMEVLDTTIINVALPQMAGNLGATTQEIGWVSTGYILSNVIILPLTAFLAQRFGRKRYLVFSVLVFIIASFLCGISTSLGEIVLWRIVQGAGGAALLSTAQATLRQIFPQEQQGFVQALFLMGIIVAPTLGPTLGGWITDNYTWNWCFFINVPIGIAAMFLITTFLHDPPTPKHTGSVDWAGIGLLALGLGCLQYVLEEGEQDDWFQDEWIVRLSIVAAVSLITMLWWELTPRNKAPVVNFRVLKNRDLAAAIFLFVALGFGLYGGVYLYPLFSQSILGFSPTTSGLTLLPGGLATAASALICGRILNGPKPLIDPRILIFFGVGMFMYSMWDLGHLNTLVGEPEVRNALLIRGFGLGFLFTPINNAAYSKLKPNEVQQASGLINLARQLGGSFGIAILGTYLDNHTKFHRAMLVENLNPANPQVAIRMNALTSGFHARGVDPDTAQRMATKALDGIVQRQAATMSYNDSFLLILLAFALTAPAILVLRKPTGGGGAAADAH